VKLGGRLRLIQPGEPCFAGWRIQPGERNLGSGELELNQGLGIWVVLGQN
jgi:hypothetical protein